MAAAQDLQHAAKSGFAIHSRTAKGQLGVALDAAVSLSDSRHFRTMKVAQPRHFQFVWRSRILPTILRPSRL